MKTLQRQFKHPCSECGSEFDHTAYYRIDAEAEPLLREKLLDRSLFFATCPACEGRSKVPQDFRYYDFIEGQRFVIRYTTVPSAMAQPESTPGVNQHFAREPGVALEIVRRYLGKEFVDGRPPVGPPTLIPTGEVSPARKVGEVEGDSLFSAPQIIWAVVLVAMTMSLLKNSTGIEDPFSDFDVEDILVNLAGVVGSSTFIYVGLGVGLLLSGVERRRRRQLGWLILGILVVPVMYIFFMILPPPRRF